MRVFFLQDWYNGGMLNDKFSSGLAAIDKICHSLLVGDNVVWRTADYSMYRDLCAAVLETGRQLDWPLIYFRFANHDTLTEDPDVNVYWPSPEKGFEHFISGIHSVIEKTGPEGVYLFDSLSDLREMYFSDRMIGCFFELTCPYLRRMETIAYFMLDPSAHSRYAFEPIRRTTQIWLDAYSIHDLRYVQPVKTWHDPSGDESPLFLWKGDVAEPVQDSITEASVRQSAGWLELPSNASRQLDMWDAVMLQFEELQRVQDAGQAESLRLREIASRMLLSSDERMLDLLDRFITPADIVAIYQRAIGTGQIGGKAVGMLLARAILSEKLPDTKSMMEPHDSFFIGSDVFYTYLVENDCWWERRALQASPDNIGSEQLPERLAEKILSGTFSGPVIQSLSEMLDYYGNAPIIVRSSSLLEDNFGNAFAGKYDSFFLANQGSREKRLDALQDAIRKIYAGTVSSDALAYRKERGVLDKDEQMALMVQRVSGRRRGDLFFPDIAGVGLSWNPYVWHDDMRPEAGISRIVLGLGTRAVDRTQDDTARIMAHDQPCRQPDSSRQRRLDALSLGSGVLMAVELKDASKMEIPTVLLERDWRREREAQRLGVKAPELISVEPAICAGDLPQILQKVSSCLEHEYGTPVEFEFACNWHDEKWFINMLQCRPFQIITTPGGSPVSDALGESDISDSLITASGPVIGHGRHERVDVIVWVDPAEYSQLPEAKRYDLANKLGQTIQGLRKSQKSVFLMGPGRWGTSTPSMGVPVKFGQIRGIAALGEMDWMHDNLSPDLSLGTHFFHDLVEENVLYAALQKSNCQIEWEKLKKNSKSDDNCIFVHHGEDKFPIMLLADPVKRKLVLFRQHGTP
ncbi:MAG: hypothetical protein D6B26_00440 [Spirochaetaceae bacterium]|nr:MAG: hypothetical protein D6B26_00440 [Spirochaetaceae bacterium]